MAKSLSALSLKHEGEDLRKQGKFSDAIKRFDQALKIVTNPHEAGVLLLDRCNARVDMGSLDQALKDAGAVLSISPEHQGALLSLAKVLYELRRYRECEHNLKMLSKSELDSLQASSLLRKSQARLREESGRYDFEVMLDEAISTAPGLQMDRASFTGPIEVRACQNENCGYGYFSTQDLKAGDLLLVEKAFMAVSGIDKVKSASLDQEDTIRICKADPVLRAKLVSSTFKQLAHNQSLVPSFARMYAGPEEEEIDEKTGYPVLSKDFVDRRTMYNSFAANVLPKGWDWRRAEMKENASIKEGMDGQIYTGMGIWITASFFNHSCVQNIRRTFLGDMIIIRAQTDIPANTELVFPYTLITQTLAERNKGLENYGFTCTCALCESERRTPPAKLSQRKAISNKIADTFTSSSSSLPALATYLEMLAVLQSTYTSAPYDEPRTTLIKPVMTLLPFAKEQMQFQPLVYLCLTLLLGLGFDYSPSLISDDRFHKQTETTPLPRFITRWGFLEMDTVILDVLANLWWVGKMLGKKSWCKALKRDARTVYTIATGEGESFDGVYAGRFKLQPGETPFSTSSGKEERMADDEVTPELPGDMNSAMRWEASILEQVAEQVRTMQLSSDDV